MKEFFQYFFGKGTKPEFQNFTLAHFLPILLMIGLIVAEMSYFWRLVGVPSLNPNPVDHLPITVCGWVVIFASYMVIGKSKTLFDICYFWLFAGTIFALITPTVITYTGPGANYLYMAKPEDTPSILDILPPNFALRILVMAAAVTALFFLSYLPWLLLDRKKKKALAAAE